MKARTDAQSRELLILGSGSAAFAAAIRAAELGARVTLIEKDTIGGTCVNVGCVPSKTLIKAAEIFFRRRNQPFHGLPAGSGSLDFAKLVAQKDDLVSRLRQEKYREVLEAHPSIEYVEGEARFQDPRAVEVLLPQGERRQIRAERILIATGASSWVPPIEGMDQAPYWTNVEALAANCIPANLLIIGGSAVGAELGQMFSRLGSRVTLIEVLATLVPNEDPELGRALAEYFRQEGIAVHTEAIVKSVSQTPEGCRLELEIHGNSHSITGDQLLMATGRRANTKRLNLEAAGVKTDQKGFIIVDEYLGASQAHIYAAGDCIHLPQFVYVAAKAGTIAAQNALTGAKEKIDLSAMPALTFTDPQVASVGLTEAAARAGGLDAEVRVLPLEYVPRALANRDTRGLMKIVARSGDGKILGVQVLSPSAGEVIQSAVLAIKTGLTVAELGDTLFPYLTEVEGLKLAAQTFGKDVKQLSCCAG
ncbi:MAG: mercury(II) reductase [Acidobacteriota bacterium]